MLEGVFLVVQVVDVHARVVAYVEQGVAYQGPQQFEGVPAVQPAVEPVRQEHPVDYASRGRLPEMQHRGELLLQSLVLRYRVFVGLVALYPFGELVEAAGEAVAARERFVEHAAHEREDLVLVVLAYEHVHDLPGEQGDLEIVAVVAHEGDHGAEVACLRPVDYQRVAQRAHVDNGPALLPEGADIGFRRYGGRSAAAVLAYELQGHQVFQIPFVDELDFRPAVVGLDIAQYGPFGLVEQFSVGYRKPSLPVYQSGEPVQRGRRVGICPLELAPVDAVGGTAMLVFLQDEGGYGQHYLMLLPACVGAGYLVGHIGEQRDGAVGRQVVGQGGTHMVGAGYLEYQRVLQPHERHLRELVEAAAHLIQVLVYVPGAPELVVAESVDFGILVPVPSEHQLRVSLHLKLEEGLPGVAAAGEEELEAGEFRTDEQLAEGFVEAGRASCRVVVRTLVVQAFVDGVEEDEHHAPFFLRPLVQLPENLAGILSRRGPEDAPQRLGQALAGEVGTAEYEHRVVALRNLLGPPAELVGLALAGFAQQREQGLAACGEGFEQGSEVPALHEKLAVVFLLPVDPAEEA